MPVTAAASDDDMPLAKRQRVLQGALGASTLPRTSHRAPSPEVVELLDDSDDPEAPAYAPESSGPSPPSGRAGEEPPSRQPSSPPVPVEVGEVEEIEVGMTTTDDDADVIVIEDDEEGAAVGGNKGRKGPSGRVPVAVGQKRVKEAATAAAKAPPTRLPSLFDPSHPFSPGKKGVSNGTSVRGSSPPRPAPQRAEKSSGRPDGVSTASTAAVPKQRPVPRGPALDDPYVFTDPCAGAEFRRNFGKPPRSSPGMSQAALERRAREILNDMARPAEQAMQKSKVAWTAAAMLWREKNKPSQAEIKQRAAEDAARAAGLRPRPGPREHAARAAGGASSGDEGGAAPPPCRPDAGAPEAEWRAYYRGVAQAKLWGCTTFAAVLRVFGVPCDDSSRGLKDAYRLAVRMFHPDSNSRERAWATPKEKMQAEEVMKIINEQKELQGF